VEYGHFQIGALFNEPRLNKNSLTGTPLSKIATKLSSRVSQHLIQHLVKY